MTTESHIQAFNEHRPLLFGIAWRMLGNPSDADDILQEGLLRWLRTNPLEIRSPRAFLVTMVTRLCLNHLNLARVRKEIPLDTDAPLAPFDFGEVDPAHDIDLADALDAALSVVLKCLSPVERAVFLLREVFECDYAEVSRIVEKSEANCRQIISRARERIAGRDTRFEVTLDEQDAMLREFLNATANGDLERLARSFAGDATLVRDGENLGAIAPQAIHGAAAVSEYLIRKMADFTSRQVTVRRSSFRQVPLLLAYSGGKLVNAIALVFRAGCVKTVYFINCPVRLRSIAAQCPALEGEAH